MTDTANPAIPSKYRDDGVGLNRTIAALMDRGIDTHKAQSLKAAGYTLAKLQGLADTELAALAIPPHAIARLRENRPPIPPETLTALFIANRFTCCVCKITAKGVIVHHIEEWSQSHSHVPENLAVLCLEHHDAAHKKAGLTQNLTSDLIRQFKKEWEEKAQHLPNATDDSRLEQSGADLGAGDIQRQAYYSRVSDQDIAEGLNHLRQARFLFGFPARDAALRLAEKVEQAELAGGSAEARARTLAWCARILSTGETLERAKALAAKARLLATTEEGDLADAFILANTDRPGALKKLQEKNTDAARSAALRIMVNSENPTAALVWANKAGLGPEAFDAMENTPTF